MRVWLFNHLYGMIFLALFVVLAWFAYFMFWQDISRFIKERRIEKILRQSRIEEEEIDKMQEKINAMKRLCDLERKRVGEIDCEICSCMRRKKLEMLVRKRMICTKVICRLKQIIEKIVRKQIDLIEHGNK